MTSEQRSAIENAIWLCATHAALVDRDEARYTRDVLLRWKQAHEGLIADTLAGAHCLAPAPVLEPAGERSPGEGAAEAVLRATLLRAIADWRNLCFEAGNLRALDLGAPVRMTAAGGRRSSGYARFVDVQRGSFIVPSDDGSCVELRRSDGSRAEILAMSAITSVEPIER